MTGRRGLVASLRFERDGFELDAELCVAPGETVALVGPNGAGKSTVIELLAGRHSVSTAGSIRLDDIALDDPAVQRFVPTEHRRVGVIFQDHLLFDHLTVRDNVAFGPRAGGVGRGEARRRASEWLAALHVNDLAERRPGELSGGQAQRVAIARALAAEPDLLLMDEPLSALDVETRVGVRRVLREHLRSFDGPAVVITHDPADAALLADRIVVLEAGRITQDGTPDEIRRRPATRYIASLTGTNLVRGTATRGVVETDQRHVLHLADSTVDGPVICSIRPQAISVHVERPVGSPRNAWPTTIDVIESMGDTTRLTVGAPLPLAIDLTTEAVAALRLEPGASVWVAVKATEISSETSGQGADEVG